MAELSGTVEGPSTTSLHSTVLTFLIADVRGYTRFTNEHGVSAAARLADRFAVFCKATVSLHDGEVIELRGDEVLAVFSSPRSALLAAVELQGRFRDETVTDPSMPIRVGMGIDVGEVVPIQGGYRGKALNLAARLCSLAGPGEVFSSEEVVQQAERIEGMVYVERGRVQLKGFSEPIRVIHVLPQEDLPEGFPPLVSLVARPSNLPLQTTPFIGREHEVRAVTDLLRKEEIRLLTLTGAGGTGKTRLALQVGAVVLEDYERGVFFVNLAPLTDAELVAFAIAATFKVKEVPGHAILDTLIEYLHDRQMLLVLDNFEHVLAAASLVQDLLVGCPDLTILVTSRAILHLSSEHEYAVPPLAVPDPERLPDLEYLSHYDAVAFFIERATSIKPGFRVTNENAPAVAAICYQLDGLPLAIELAAARIRLFPPQALLQRLSSPLTLLTGGATDRPSRHRTMREAIDWSYSLLDPKEQSLFARLSVFAGGSTFEAAEAICNFQGDLDVLEGMTSLVEKSLLRQEGGEEPRFSMLETIREYATERLAEQKEANTVRDNHAMQYLELACEAEPELRGPSQGEWFGRLEADHDNLRAALGWLLERGHAEQELSLATSLHVYWNMRGYFTEAMRWLEAGLALGDRAATEIRAKSLNHVGLFCGTRGEHERAIRSLEEALSIFQALGNKAGSATVLLTLGSDVYIQGDVPRATRCYEDSLEYSRELGDRQGIADVLSMLGTIASEAGDFEVAEAHHREALALERELRDTGSVATSLNNLGYTLLQRGEYEEASDALEECVALARELGMKSMLPAFLDSLACLVREQGDYGRAEELFAEGLSGSHQLGIKWVFLYILGHMAELAMLQGKAQRAVTLAGAEAAGREAAGMFLVPVEQEQRERTLSRVRQELGERAFRRAWEAGKSMTMEEAVAYALGTIQQ